MDQNLEDTKAEKVSKCINEKAFFAKNITKTKKNKKKSIKKNSKTTNNNIERGDSKTSAHRVINTGSITDLKGSIAHVVVLKGGLLRHKLNQDCLLEHTTFPENIKRTFSNLSKISSRSRKVRDSTVESLNNNVIEDWKTSTQISTKSSNSSRFFSDMRVRINVSGEIFEIHTSLLDTHPQTLLGNPSKCKRFFDHNRKELFFDRHRPSFESIFFYFQYGGLIRRPYHVPNDIFLEELLFFELESEIIDEYKRAEGYSTEEVQLPSNATSRFVWRLFEYPDTSHTAFLVALLSVIMTVVSIVLFCIETLPMFANTHCVSDEAPNFTDPFFVLETSCTLWFTVELIARFFSCPSKIIFLKDLKNLIDMAAIMPYYITLTNVLISMSCSSAKSSASLSFLRVIRLVRVFKLTKHSVGLQILLMTFRASLEGLGLFLVALMVSLLVFSSAIYYAELGHAHSQMHSIPDAFWWAIITMTTVGYGDKVPVGALGKLIGAACAVTGVLTLAIPVPIITGHFNRFYAHKTGRGRHV